MARLILFDLDTSSLSWIVCNELEDYYKHLKCRYFNIVSVNLNGTSLDVYVDEEGLLRNKALSAVLSDVDGQLVGNLIFARHDEEGETIDCTEDDMKLIASRRIRVIVPARGGRNVTFHILKL